METVVVNLYKEPFDIYVGRPGKGQNGEFGNPFHGPDRAENIESFRKYFYDRLKTDPLFARRVRSLRGKRLGCFCVPKPCHATVIAEYLNGLPEEIPLRLAVIGSRTFNDYAFLTSILDWYTIKEIISGGARGADSFAARYAIEHNILLREFKPDWDRLGKAAGFKRNEQIIAAADEVVAFWDHSSRGTAHSIQLAQEQGKPVAIYWPEIVQTIPHDEISSLG